MIHPTFTRDEYSLETVSKLSCFLQDNFEQDSKLDYSIYDYVINFEDTFDIQCMIDLFCQINHSTPTTDEIDILLQTNKLNSIQINKNHAASIAKLCFEKEKQLNLKESRRWWSITDVYSTVSIDQLYDTISKKISIENYGQTPRII